MVAELGELGPAQRSLVARLHANCGVEFRHLVFPIEEYRDVYGIGPSNERYAVRRPDLRSRLSGAPWTRREFSPGDLDLLIVTSVTGVLVPSIDARLISRLGLRPDIKRLPIFGLGCVAGAAALGRLHDYLLAWRGAHGRAAVGRAVLAELAAGRDHDRGPGGQRPVRRRRGRGGRPGRTGGGTHRRNARPGGPSGGTAVRGSSPRAARSTQTAATRSAGGWAGRLPHRADHRPVRRGRAQARGGVTSFLAEHGLTVDDIGSWICHPGGPKVIDAIRRSLKLPDSAVAVSRRSLAEVGNLSSASVLHVLEMTLARCPPPAGSYGVMIGLGPGVSVELVLLQW